MINKPTIVELNNKKLAYKFSGCDLIDSDNKDFIACVVLFSDDGKQKIYCKDFEITDCESCVKVVIAKGSIG